MHMLDKLLIEKKLRRIEELLRELVSVQVGTIDEFKSGYFFIYILQKSSI